nr:hypothetical protein [Tanacetum cinerariifolium]
AQQTSPTTHSSPTLPPVTTAPIPTVTPSDTPPLRHYTRRTRIAQSSVLLPVADEPASPLVDGSQGEARPTDSGFEADQDRANIAKTSTLPSDSAPRVTCLAADEGSMQQKLDELTAFCTSLQRQHSEMVAKFEAQELKINSLKARIQVLEDEDRRVVEQSGDDAPIKGRRLDVGEEAAERVSDDTEEMATVLTSMDAATVLSSGVAEVPTGSGSIPTAGPPTAGVPTGSDVVPTAGLIFSTANVVTPYTRRKGKEKMIESETSKKKKIQEQMDIQMARQLEEEMEREAQMMNEQIARDAEIARIHAEEELQIMIDGLDRSNETVAKYLQEYHQFATELPIERRIELISDLVRKKQNGLKGKGIRFEQESVKKLKTSEEVKASEVVPEEKVKEMMQLVPIEEHLDREDLNQLWRIVKESLSIRSAASDKEIELWVELKRLYEPDVEDQLWTHTQNLMHAPVEWKLHDTCGVHHVTSKDKEIFMLVEKDYPLRKGLAIVMISYKLQVENYSQMANDLILKIYKIANCPIMEFPLPGEVPTASEESFHCQKKRDATAYKIALLLKSSSNCQSKSYDCYAKLPENFEASYNFTIASRRPSNVSVIRYKQRHVVAKENATRDAIAVPDGRIEYRILEMTDVGIRRKLSPFQILHYLGLDHVGHLGGRSRLSDDWPISSNSRSPATEGTGTEFLAVANKRRHGKNVTAIDNYKIEHYCEKKKRMVSEEAATVLVCSATIEEAAGSGTPVKICFKLLKRVSGHLKGRSAPKKEILAMENLKAIVELEKNKSTALEEKLKKSQWSKMNEEMYGINDERDTMFVKTRT